MMAYDTAGRRAPKTFIRDAPGRRAMGGVLDAKRFAAA